MIKGAIISKCGKYRHKLWRIWDESKPCVMWVMHNPSTADADNDDPTIRRIIQFSKDWGYGGIYVGNLSPYRSTDPVNLIRLTARELHPVDELDHFEEMIEKCLLHVLACGIPVKGLSANEPRELYPNITWRFLKLTKMGFPSHPLYLPKNLTPRKYNHFS